jgi:hypothetical protein
MGCDFFTATSTSPRIPRKPASVGAMGIMGRKLLRIPGFFNESVEEFG